MKKLLITSLSLLFFLSFTILLKADITGVGPSSGGSSTGLGQGSGGDFSGSGTTMYSIVPGLYGFGTDTRAAYGATNDPKIFVVTNTNHSNGTPGDSDRNGTSVKTGSFLEALKYSPPANTGVIIIFEVSGTINATSLPYEYEITNPYTSVYGQTAPSPGITLKNIMVKVKSTHDVVLQHIRPRIGDSPDGVLPDYSHPISITSGSADTYNVVIDHCSGSWSMDTLGLFWEEGGYNTYDCTWSNSIFGEPLHDSLHSKGAHGYGPVLNAGTTNIAILNNFFISSVARNPLISSNSTSAVVNNYIYNPRDFNIQLQVYSATYIGSIVGNLVEGGPNTIVSAYENHMSVKSLTTASQIYLYDNKCGKEGESYYTQNSADDWTRIRWRAPQSDISEDVKELTAPIWPTGLVAMNVDNVKTNVLANVGARPADRDTVDTRLVSEANGGTGSIKDSVVDGTIYYPMGTATGGTINTIVLESMYINFDDNVLNGRGIEITGGTGEGQSRTVSDWVESTLTATVSVNWVTTPDNTSEYRVLFTSTNGAGGWPVLDENNILLEIPSNPHSDDDSDGYTNLEEWIHDYSTSVE